MEESLAVGEEAWKFYGFGSFTSRVRNLGLTGEVRLATVEYAVLVEGYKKLGNAVMLGPLLLILLLIYLILPSALRYI